MLLAAEHRAAGRRELFEAHFSLLQLTQEVPASMERNDRKVYLFQGPAHESNSQCSAWKVWSPLFLCSPILFLFLCLYNLSRAFPMIPWIPFMCGIVTQSVGVADVGDVNATRAH